MISILGPAPSVSALCLASLGGYVSTGKESGGLGSILPATNACCILLGSLRQVQEYKHEIERLQREMTDVKRRYFEQKRAGQLPSGGGAGSGQGEQQLQRGQRQQDEQQQAAASTGLATLAAKSAEIAATEHVAAGDAQGLIPAVRTSALLSTAGSVAAMLAVSPLVAPSSGKATPAAPSALSASTSAC